MFASRCEGVIEVSIVLESTIGSDEVLQDNVGLFLADARTEKKIIG